MRWMLGFDGVKNLIGLFQTRPRRRPHMQAELAGVDQRKKILAGKQRQNSGADKHHGKFNDHKPAMPQRPCQRAAIFLAPFFKMTIEPSMKMPKNIAALVFGALGVTRHFAGQQILHHRRHQGARKEVGGQHRQHHGQRHRRE